MSLIILNDEKKGPWFIYSHDHRASKEGTYYEAGSLTIQLVEGLNGRRFLCSFEDATGLYLPQLKTFFQETLSKVEHINHEYLDNEFLPPLREKLRSHYLLMKGDEESGIESLPYLVFIASSDGIFQIEHGAYAFKKHFLCCDDNDYYGAFYSMGHDPTIEDLISFMDEDGELVYGGVTVHFPTIRGYLYDDSFIIRDGNLHDHPLAKEALICR